MTYSECKEYIAAQLDRIDLDDVDDCLLQMNIIGAEGGTFYIDIKNHSARLADDETGEYAVKYVLTATVLTRLIENVIDPIYGYAAGKYKMLGDVKLGRQMLAKLCERR